MSHKVRILGYGGPPLDNGQLADLLGLPTHYTYLVATTALERWRAEGFKPPGQLDGDEPRLYFPIAIRQLLGGHGLLTRTEERVLLRRLLPKVAASGLGREEQLLRDSGLWVEAVADCVARGEDLRRTETLRQLRDEWACPVLGDIVAGIQGEWWSIEVDGTTEGRRSFEALARDWVDSRPDLGDLLVLEGFTRLTALQAHLLDTLSTYTDTVVLVPYDRRLPKAYAQLARTYRSYWGSGPVGASEASPTAAALHRARERLFVEPPEPLGPDGSLRVHAFPHRHDEVAACVLRAKQLLDDGVAVEDIAVVVPSTPAFAPLLQEEAERFDLPVALGLPPRLLLLTPLGRFILTLYELWGGGRLTMTAEQFEALLGSGWLGARAQLSVRRFHLVRQQLFERLQTMAEWQSLLAAWRTDRPQFAVDRVPSSMLDDVTVALWIEVVDQVEGIVRRLFTTADRSIGEHVRLLLDELDGLPLEQVLATERELIERIREALTQAAEASTLDISADEFGELLTALAREYEATADGDVEAAAPPQGRLWVTTPDGIDGVTRRVVLMLGVDEVSFPRPFSEGWPRTRGGIDAHLDQERYRFVAVVRAATELLELSYARRVGRSAVGPSPYLQRLVVTPTAPPRRAPAVPATPRVATTTPRRRTSYRLDELVQVATCEWRYALERLDPEARVLHDLFHTGPLLQAAWFHHTLSWAETEGGLHWTAEDVVDRLRSGLSAVRPEVAARFPAVRPLLWFTAERRLLDQFGWISSHIAPRSFPLRFAPAPRLAYDLVVGDDLVEVVVPLRHAYRSGAFLRRIDTDVMHELWVLPPKGDNDDTGWADAERTRFATRYGAFVWWKQAVTAALAYTTRHIAPAAYDQYFAPRHRQVSADLVRLVDAANRSSLEKRPGDQCIYCPVRSACLGLNP